MKLQKQQSWLVVSCVACLVIVLHHMSRLEGTEFSGGWLTGQLLHMADIGTMLLVLALVVTMWTPHIAAVLGLTASLLCLPLYLYVVAPVLFSEVFGAAHPFKAQPDATFRWDSWAIAGVLTIAVTTCVCVRGLAVSTGPRLQQRR